jgi:hypothetical protein
LALNHQPTFGVILLGFGAPGTPGVPRSCGLEQLLRLFYWLAAADLEHPAYWSDFRLFFFFLGLLN